MFDLLMVSMIKEFVAKGVNLPGESFDDVDAEVLQGQLGDTDTMEKCKVYDIGGFGKRLCSMVWTLGRSAGWYAVSQSLCCPYFWDLEKVLDLCPPLFLSPL